MSFWKRQGLFLAFLLIYFGVMALYGLGWASLLALMAWLFILALGFVGSVRRRRAHDRALQKWRQQTGLDSVRGFRLDRRA